MSLGPHATFIVLSYGAGCLTVLALLIWVIADYRAQKIALATLEREGVTRRSNRA